MSLLAKRGRSPYRGSPSTKLIAAEQEMQRALDLAERAYLAVKRERERCMAICALWPDNLMAQEISRRIAQPPVKP